MSEETPLDALIVGGGFSGCFMLNNLRSGGLRVKLYEAGGDLGGVWYWNNYPGARADSEFYIYQLSDPKLFKDFDYPQRFPARDDILKYFQHLETVLHLKKDCVFNNKVEEAKFNGDSWEVKSTSGVIFARHLILCTGVASKPYSPPFPGMEKFKGEVYHSAHWPRDTQVNFKGKRVGVIGTGASGVQVIQEVGPLADHLTVFQRTPNLALPMRQLNLPDISQPTKDKFPGMLAQTRAAFGGMPFVAIEKDTCQVPPEERQAAYEKLWATGGFSFWLGNFQDIFIKEKANDAAYFFWAEQTRKRLDDPQKKDILAPLTPPHPFGTKRPSLEQNYYEVLNQPNVNIVDLNDSPILEITEKGLLTRANGEIPLDILILATGFDSITGSLLKIQIENNEGHTLQDKWNKGTSTYLGMTCAGFPNLFFLYGPQAPTAFSNGPTCAEIQGEWLSRLLISMRNNGQVTVQPTLSAEAEWTKGVADIWASTLFPRAKSWYQGHNIPGKPIEPLSFAGGMLAYSTAILQAETNNYAGFTLK